MPNTTLAIVDGAGSARKLLASADTSGNLSPYHVEDTDQRTTLISTLTATTSAVNIVKTAVDAVTSAVNTVTTAVNAVTTAVNAVTTAVNAVTTGVTALLNAQADKYTLATSIGLAAGAAGPTVAVTRGGYFFFDAAFSGTSPSLKLQRLGADGSTWIDVVARTVAGSGDPVGIPSGSQLRVLNAGSNAMTAVSAVLS